MLQPNFSYEKRLWQKGFNYVAGVDEVGRGAFAGPIVTAAVIFPKKIIEIDGLNDSKLLKPRFREQLEKEIKKKALAWDVTEVSVGVINQIGIGKATEKAMRKTVKDIIKLLNCSTQQCNNLFVLIDYFYVPYLRGVGKKNPRKSQVLPGSRGRQLGIRHGDQKCFSIAAASILAKVHRDKIMRSLARNSRYKKYLWGKNKGYGTKVHIENIIRYGLTRYHRKKFVESWRLKRN